LDAQGLNFVICCHHHRAIAARAVVARRTHDTPVDDRHAGRRHPVDVNVNACDLTVSQSSRKAIVGVRSRDGGETAEVSVARIRHIKLSGCVPALCVQAQTQWACQWVIWDVCRHRRKLAPRPPLVL